MSQLDTSRVVRIDWNNIYRVYKEYLHDKARKNAVVYL